MYRMEYYIALKKEKILPITRMDLQDIMLSDISQSPKSKYRTIPLV